MRIALVLVFAACGGARTTPKDLGRCEPFDHDGKPYYLCERSGSTVVSNTPARETPPTETERVRAAEARRDQAEQDAREAQKLATEAMERVDALQRTLEDLDKRVGAAVDSVIAAQSDADRANAKAQLERLRKEKAEMEARLAAAKAAAGRATRKQGAAISKECQDNPLAKGCS